MPPPGALVAGAVVVPGAVVVAAVEVAPKRLGAALLVEAGAVVVFVANILGAAVFEDVAAVVAGGLVNNDVVWVGAVVAADVVAGADVAAGNSDEGFEAGVEPVPGAPPNNDEAVVLGAADSVGLEVAPAPGKRVEGVDEAALVEVGNGLLGFWVDRNPVDEGPVDAVVDAAPPPKRDPGLLAAG